MKGIRHFPILILVTFVISALSGGAVYAQSTPAEPGWLTGNSVYRKSEAFLASSGCSLAIRHISGVYDRVYESSNDGRTTQEVCVYRGKGYEYARYTRTYYTNPLTKTNALHESGI